MPPMARPKGQGTIVPGLPTPTGQKRWVVAVTMADGRRVYRKAASPKEADRIRRQLVEARELDLDPTRQTVAGYLRSWIAGLRNARHQRVRPRTLDHYEMIVERHIIPALGALKLSQLTVPQVQAWVDADPLAARTRPPPSRRPAPRAERRRPPAAARVQPGRPGRDAGGRGRPIRPADRRRDPGAARDDRRRPAAPAVATRARHRVPPGRAARPRVGRRRPRGGHRHDPGAAAAALPPERGGDAQGWARTPPKAARTLERVAIAGETLEVLAEHRDAPGGRAHAGVAVLRPRVRHRDGQPLPPVGRPDGLPTGVRRGRDPAAADSMTCGTRTTGCSRTPASARTSAWRASGTTRRACRASTAARPSSGIASSQRWPRERSPAERCPDRCPATGNGGAPGGIRTPDTRFRS
jgi:hypothetical protein